jgi:hypothetical protein
MKRPIWFGPKRHGIGISPNHPIGWLLLVLLVVAIVLAVHLIFAATQVPIGLTVLIASFSVFFILVSLTYKK